METQYGIEQPLRLHENLMHQNQHRSNTDITPFKLYCPLNYLLPFQIRRIAGIRDLTSIQLVNNITNAKTEIINNLDESELERLSFENFDYLIHYGQLPHTATIAQGDYYIEVTDGTTIWYSEVMTFVDFDKDNIAGSCIKTKIEYWDKYNVADMFYRTYQFTNKQYKNVMYLDLAVGRPQWDYEIEGDRDGDGQLVPETLTREKEYLLQGVFPEYFIDALSMIPLHQSVNSQILITTEYGYTSTINRVELGEPDWTGGDGGNGRLAKIDVNFALVTRIKTNCASAIVPLTSCVRTNFSYETLLLEGTAHYNNGTFIENITDPPRSITHGATVAIEYASGLVELKTFDSTNDGTPATMYRNHFVTYRKGDVFTNRNLPIGSTEPYLFYSGSTALGFITNPVLLSVSAGGGATGGSLGLPVVRGRVITNSLIELWRKGEGGDSAFANDTYVQDVKPEDVNGNGAAATLFSGVTYYIKMIGLNCELGISNEKIS